jgi:hypothetical protein
LQKAKVKLSEELEKNDKAGQKLLIDSSACNKVKEDCTLKLE